ncbi:nucleotidyltransferase family protein [Alicyclobacillus macrosporangiidus]|uniref:nucleotidyltransferase family protein n=1 Tax=Alicyclobacillus macrosporangiidus TaxID=392015 RepID=UPI000495462A|nr:nucleotidyltransferase family protein [Alicyclobacillus macrosporangiidus]
MCSHIMIAPTTSLQETIQIIDADARQIALVVDDNSRLMGTVTDGDVRRAILRGVGLNEPVRSIMNMYPTVVAQGTPSQTIYALMLGQGVRRIPVVDGGRRVIGLEMFEDYVDSPKRENWVVIMAGGLGTRLAPLTDTCPKPLLKVGPKPILEIILESLIAHSFHRFFFSVNYRAEMIESYFGDGSKWGVRIEYLREQKRLGTAGALSLLPHEPARPILVMNGDLLTSVDFGHLLAFHTENQSIATMCIREHVHAIPYGVVHIDGHHFLGMEEKPVQRMFVNAGIYVIAPEVLRLLEKDTYIDMTSLFHRLASQKSPVHVFPVREYWLDIGRMDDYVRANQEYGEVFL